MDYCVTFWYACVGVYELNAVYLVINELSIHLNLKRSKKSWVSVFGYLMNDLHLEMVKDMNVRRWKFKRAH